MQRTWPDRPLVQPEELAPVLETVRLLDVRFGEAGRNASTAGHLAGAIHADLDRQLAADATHPENGGRHPLPSADAFAAQLGVWGIGADTPVVAYDDKSGALAATRLWWMLRSLGHEKTAILDGGYQAAVAAGLPVETSVPDITPRPPYPHQGWRWPIVDIETVDRLRRAPDAIVLDVRAGGRFRGEFEPLDPVAGHIPGARNLSYEHNLELDGRFKPAESLRRLYADFLGNVPPERLVVHCGSGVTACHTLLALEQAGLRGASLYVGSWSEWCRSGRPLATGDE